MGKNNKCIFLHHVRNGRTGKHKIDFQRVDISTRNEDVKMIKSFISYAHMWKRVGNIIMVGRLFQLLPQEVQLWLQRDDGKLIQRHDED